MTRPRIKRTTEQIEAPNGDLYLLRPSAGADIQIENPDAEGRRCSRPWTGASSAKSWRSASARKPSATCSPSWRSWAWSRTPPTTT